MILVCDVCLGCQIFFQVGCQELVQTCFWTRMGRIEWYPPLDWLKSYSSNDDLIYFFILARQANVIFAIGSKLYSANDPISWSLDIKDHLDAKISFFFSLLSTLFCSSIFQYSAFVFFAFCGSNIYFHPNIPFLGFSWVEPILLNSTVQDHIWSPSTGAGLNFIQPDRAQPSESLHTDLFDMRLYIKMQVFKQKKLKNP